MVFFRNHKPNSKVSFLLGLLLILNSCYSYKALDHTEKSVSPGKKYLVSIAGREPFKATLLEVSDSTYLLEYHKKEVVVAIAMVTKIKERKFAPVTTVVVALAGGFLLLGIIAAVSFSAGKGPGLSFP